MTDIGAGGEGDRDAHAINFAHEVGHLSRTPRAGWLLAGIAAPESVAEHSHRVAILAFLIAAVEGADPLRACALGVFHDVPETRTTDLHSVARPHVTLADARDVVIAQVEGMPELLQALITEAIGEFEQRETPEAICAKDADKLDCLLRAREYEAQGNPMMTGWIDTMIAGVRTVTGKRWAAAAMQVEPHAWWRNIVGSYSR